MTGGSDYVQTSKLKYVLYTHKQNSWQSCSVKKQINIIIIIIIIYSTNKLV
jgi:hypothetical protein